VNNCPAHYSWPLNDNGFSASRRIFLIVLRLHFQIAELMHGNPEVDEIDPTWWQMAGHEGLPSDLEAGRPRQSDWVQHGDFTIENVFLDLTTKKMTVIDWVDLRRGCRRCMMCSVC